MTKRSSYSHVAQTGAVGQILVLFLAALLFASVVVAVVGYKVGYRQGVHTASTAESGEEFSAADATALHAENARLKEETAKISQERDISIGNLEQLRQDYEELQTTNLQLTQVNDLLKSSVAEQGGVALKVLGAQIEALPENTFEYRFDVAMLDVSGKSVRMTPKLTLLNATSMVEIPLEPSSYQIDGVANIRGRFIMPEGFTPRQMKLELIAGEQEVQQLYNWQVGKVISDAPSSLAEAGKTDKRPIATSDTKSKN
ncbi:hypothetical protein B0181_09425 [Moraxella caviae]|uniref:Uncharacterized protein n=1 Tax=Moraxella caviae TaxID=34060 RepID=A0A1S9ZWC5_9GAMM|nr:hypothetical protein [Moraxella caviae]OOR87846.1 hypothetical protein B0181_09425 [Moraxella caviae]STZ14881.1 Uncharacterised protein [Moraxella caviae]VEW13686.1 Uncharacterised protein [Moraxella caviae]